MCSEPVSPDPRTLMNVSHAGRVWSHECWHPRTSQEYHAPGTCANVISGTSGLTSREYKWYSGTSVERRLVGPGSK